MKRIVLIISMLLFANVIVNTQSISLGPQVGFQKAVDADEGKFMGGAALRLILIPGLGIEASINYREEKYMDGGLTVRSWPIMITGMYYFLPIVYGAVGTGWYNTTFDFNQDKFPFKLTADETKQKIGWHFGGGLELPIGTNAKFIADLRYVFIDYNFDYVPGFSDTKSNFYLLSAGLLFNL